MDDDKFAELIRGARAKLDASQAQLAEACGVPVTTLRNWEQGRRRPDLGTAYRLAKALKVPLETLGKVADEQPLRKAHKGKPKKKSKGG